MLSKIVLMLHYIPYIYIYHIKIPTSYIQKSVFFCYFEGFACQVYTKPLYYSMFTFVDNFGQKCTDKREKNKVRFSCYFYAYFFSLPTAFLFHLKISRRFNLALVKPKM